MKDLNKALLIALWAGSTISLGLVAIWALWMIPGFVEIFGDFEQELPLITQLLVLSYAYYWIFPLISLLCGITTVCNKHSVPQAAGPLGGLFVCGIILAFVLFIGSVFAIYAPILSVKPKEKGTSHNQSFELTRYNAQFSCLNHKAVSAHA